MALLPETISFKKLLAKSYTICSRDELEFILSLRNHPKIRENLFTQHEILLSEHLTFVESLKSANDRIYYLVSNDSGIIGTINLTEIDLVQKSAYIGLFANIFNPKKNKGLNLMELIFYIAVELLGLKKIYLEVFEKNSVAIRLYKKFGFEIIDRYVKMVNQEKLLVLKMKKEAQLD